MFKEYFEYDVQQNFVPQSVMSISSICSGDALDAMCKKKTLVI